MRAVSANDPGPRGTSASTRDNSGSQRGAEDAGQRRVEIVAEDGGVSVCGGRQGADHQPGTGREPVEPIADQVPQPAYDPVPLHRATDRAAHDEPGLRAGSAGPPTSAAGGGR